MGARRHGARVSDTGDSTDIQARAAMIRRLFLDIDGVMTDCNLHLTPVISGLSAQRRV